MKLNIRIQELRSCIREKEKELQKIKDDAIRYSSPMGYPSGTSYEDYDCIHGSKKRVDVCKLAEDIQRLETLIEIDKHILKQLEKEKDIEKKVNEIESMEEKLVYLRKLGLTVEEASEVLYISTRQAYRYLRRVREREE
jgi:hypothetical protein